MLADGNTLTASVSHTTIAPHEYLVKVIIIVLNILKCNTLYRVCAGCWIVLSLEGPLSPLLDQVFSQKIRQGVPSDERGPPQDRTSQSADALTPCIERPEVRGLDNCLSSAPCDINARCRSGLRTFRCSLAQENGVVPVRGFLEIYCEGAIPGIIHGPCGYDFMLRPSTYSNRFRGNKPTLY